MIHVHAHFRVPPGSDQENEQHFYFAAGSVQRIRIFAKLVHAARNLARAETGVNQHTRAVGDQQHRVASRTATEYRDFHEKT